MKVSNEIYKASKKYKIPARVYTAILMQESHYKLEAERVITGHRYLSEEEVETRIHKCIEIARKFKGEGYNECEQQIVKERVTDFIITDYGIAQIYYKTVESYGFDRDKLLDDLTYSIDAGAKVLSYFHKRFSKKESDWWVRYNVGTRSKKKMKRAWNEYKLLVSRYL